MDITNIAFAEGKVTVTHIDGTTQDFMVPAVTATQTVQLHAGDTLEVTVA